MLLFKLIILGDAAVGKTSLLNMYIDNKFNEHEESTIGVEFGSKTIPMSSIIRPDLLRKYEKERNKHLISVPEKFLDTLKLQIWGCSGQERFHSIVRSYYRNVKGVVFVCDLTRRETFNSITRWIDDFNKNSNEDFDEIAKVIIGNKTDLGELIEVSEEELKTLANKYDCQYFALSSKKDISKVGEVFKTLGNQIFENYLKVPDDDPIRLQYVSGIALSHHDNPQDHDILRRASWSSRCC